MISHVIVGYSAALLGDLEKALPIGSVMVIEEPSVIEAREVRAAIEGIACVAELVEAPTQAAETNPALVTSAVARPEGVRVVMPAFEYGVVAAAALAEEWGLPGSTLEAARTLRDKRRLRTVADLAGIPQPRWTVPGSAAEAAGARDDFNGSCVIKLANRQASLGVQLLGADDDMDAAWTFVQAANSSAEPRLWSRAAQEADVLVEERLLGPEFSVEMFVRSKEIIFMNVTAKSVHGSRHPVEVGHVVPADLDQPQRNSLEGSMRRLIAAIGFDTGILHGEWIMIGGLPHLIECAGRIPGDSIHKLINLAYGIDVVRSLVALLAGEEPALSTIPLQAAAIRFLTPPPGTVTRVSLGESASLPGVVEVELGVSEGSEVPIVTNSWQRAGYALALGPTPKEAADRAMFAADSVILLTEPA